MKRQRPAAFGTCMMCGGGVGDRDHGAMYCFPCSTQLLKIQHRAYGRLRWRIFKGKLAHPKTLECTDCGEPARLYDHRNYVPEAIEPVCHGCNIRRGPAIDVSRFARLA